MGEGNIEQMLKDMLTKLNKTVSEEQFAGLVEHYKDNPDMIINDYATKTGKNIDLKTRVGLKRNYQVPLSFKETLALGESRGTGLSYDTTNSESSAYGPFQVTETHHKERIKSLYGADWSTFQKDPKLQEKYMDVIEEDYNKALPSYKNYPIAKQRKLTDEQVKATIHVLGSGGAKTYLQTGEINAETPEESQRRKDNLEQILNYFVEERTNFGAPAGIADQYNLSGESQAPTPQIDVTSLTVANEMLKKNTAKLKAMPKMSGEASVQRPTTSGHGVLFQTEELFKPVKDKKAELDGNILTQAADYLTDVGAGITGLFKYNTLGGGYTVSQNERKRQKELEYQKLNKDKKELFKTLPAEGIPAVSIEDAVELELVSPKVTNGLMGVPVVAPPSAEEAHRKGTLRIKEHTELLKGLVETRKETLSKEELSIIDNMNSLDPEFLKSYQMSDNMKSYVLAQKNLNDQIGLNEQTFSKFDPLVEESYKAILNARQNGDDPEVAFNNVVDKFSSENPADAAAIKTIKDKVGKTFGIAEFSVGIPVLEQAQETAYGLSKTIGAVKDFAVDHFGALTRTFSTDSKFDKDLIRDLNTDEAKTRIRDIVVNNPNDASTSDLIEELVKVGDRTLVLKNGKVDKIRDKDGKQVYYPTKQDAQAVEQFGKNPEKYERVKDVNFSGGWQQLAQVVTDMVPMIAAAAATGGGTVGMMLGSATVSYGDYYEQALAESGDISKAGLYAALTSGSIGYVESKIGKAEALLGRAFTGAEKAAIIESIEQAAKKGASKGVMAARLEGGFMQKVRDVMTSGQPILKEIPSEIIEELTNFPVEGTTAALFDMPYEAPGEAEIINTVGLTMLATTIMGGLGGVASANKENMNSLISLGVTNRDGFKEVSDAWVQSAKDRGLPEAEITRRQQEVEKKSKLIDTVGKYYDFIKEESADRKMSDEKKNSIMDLAQEKALLDYKADGSTSTIRKDKIAADAAEVQKKLDKLVYSGTDIAEPIVDSDEDIKQKEEAVAKREKDKEKQKTQDNAIQEQEAAKVSVQPETTSSGTDTQGQSQPESQGTAQQGKAQEQVQGEEVNVESFKTAKGSTYVVNQDGTTTRDKAARKEHPGQQGQQPKSTKTYYVTKDDLTKLDLVQATHPEEGAKFTIAELPDGKIAVGVVREGGENQLAANTTVEPKLKPAVGLYPVEIWEGYLQPHFGNEITEVVSKNPAPIQKQAVGDTQTTQPVLTATEAENVAPTTTAGAQTGPDAAKQEELENKIKELEKQRKDLRSEDGSIPTDKMSEFNRLGGEINEAKNNATRGNSKSSMFIKMFPEGADTATSDPQILSTEAKKEAADIIEQLIQNSKTAEEALKKIQRLGYIFDLNVKALLKKYLDDRFNSDAPRVGNNKDSFQSWIYGKADADVSKETPTPTPIQETAAAEPKKTEPQAGSVGVGGDVEATAKALEEVAKKKPNASITFINKQGYEQKVNLNDTYEFTQPEEAGLKGETIKGFRNQNNTGIIPFSEVAEAYHKAKADGSNPELVKAVEQSLKETTKAETKNQIQLSRLNKNKRAEKRDNDVIENGTIYKADKDIKLKKGKTGKRDASGKLITAHPDVKGSFFTMDPIIADEYARGGGKVIDVTIPKGATVEVVNVDQKLPLDEIRRQETELINNSKADVVKLVTMDGKGMEVQYIIPPAATKTETPQEDKATEKEVETLLEPIGKTPQERENQIFKFFALAAAGGDKTKAREIARVTNNLWENVAKQLGKRSKQAAEAWIQAKVALIGKTSVAGATGMGNVKFQADNTNLSVQQAIDKINNNLIPEIDRLIKEMSNKDNIKKRGWTTAQAAEHVRELRAVKAQVEKNMKDPKFQVAGIKGVSQSRNASGLLLALRNAEQIEARYLPNQYWKVNKDSLSDRDKQAIGMIKKMGWERGADGTWKYELPKYINDDKLYHFITKQEDGKPVLLTNLLDITYTVTRKDRDAEGNPSKVIDEKSFKDYRSVEKYIEDTGGYNKKTSLSIGQDGLREFYDIDRMKVVKIDSGGEFQAGYDSKSNTIYIDSKYAKEAQISKVVESITHELQHFIQDQEGWEGGSSHSATTDEKQTKKAIDKIIKISQEKFLPGVVRFIKDYEGLLKLSNEMPEDQFLSSKRYLEYNIIKNGKHLLSEEDLRGTFFQSFNEYTNLIGEVEARNAARRVGMDADEKITSPLYSTEDVQRSEQLYAKDLSNKYGVDVTTGKKLALSLINGIKMQQDAVTFRAATVELANNQVILAALDSPNESSFVHEMAHSFESDLLPQEKQTFIDEYNELFGEKEKGWSTDVSEYFARTWEKYLSNGRKLTSAEDKGRRETLQEVFDKFTDWLQGIYNGVIEYNNSKGVKKEITLSPAAQAIFDNINNIKTQTKDENKESSQSNGQGQRQDEKRGQGQEDEVRGQSEKGNVTTNQQAKNESKSKSNQDNKGQEGQVDSTLAEEQGKGKGEEVGDVVEGAVKLSPKYQRYVSRALATPSIPQEFKDALLKNAPLKVPVTYVQVEAFAKAVVDQLETLDDYVKAAGELVQQFAETITKVDTDPTVLNRGAWEITALKMIEKRVADNYGPTEAAKLHQRLANVGSILGQSLRQYGINDPSVMYVQTFGRHSVTESPIYDADTFEGSDVTHRDVANSLLDLYESAMQDEKDKLKAKIAAEIKAQSQKDKTKDTSSKTDADPNPDAKKAKTDLVKRLSDKADFYLNRFNSRLGEFSSGFDIEAIIDYTLYAYYKTAGSVIKTKRILEKRFGKETVDTNWDTISNSENFKKATLDIAQEKLLAAIGNAGQANEFTGTETSNRTPAQMIIQSITRQLQKKDRGPVSKKTIEEVITQKSMDIDTVSNLRRDINGGLLNVEADKRAEVLAQVDDLLAVLVKGQLDTVATPWVKKTLIRQKIKESADNLGVTVDQLIDDIANRATITNSISEEFLSRTGMSVEDAAPYIKIIEDSIESEINQKVKAKAEKLIVDSYGKNIIKLEEVVKTLERAYKFDQDNLAAKKAELSDAVRNKTKSVEELREMQKGVKELQTKAAESKKKLQTYKTRLASGQKDLKRKVSSKTFQRMPTVERVGFLVRNGGLSDETVFQAFAEVIGARNFTQADAETLRSLYERLDTSLFQIDKKEAKEAIAKFAFEIKSDIDKQIFVDILNSYAFGNMLGSIKSGDVALSSGYLTFLYQEIMSTGAQISKDIFSLITGKSSEFANIRLMLDSFSNMSNTNFSRAQFTRVALGKDGISLPEISLKGDESKGFNSRLEANLAHLDKMRSLRDRAKEHGNVRASFMYNAIIGHALVSRALILADYVTTSTLLPYKLHRNLTAASIKELTVDGLIHPSYNEIRELVASKMKLDEVEAQLQSEGLTPRVMIKGESKRSNAYHKRKAQILYEFLQESDKISLIQAEHALRTICFTGKISGYSGYAVEKLNKFFNNLSSIGEDKKSGEKKLSVLIAASLAKLTTIPFPGVTFRVAQFVKNSTPFGVIQLKDKLNRDKSIMPFKFFDEYNFYNTYTGEIETVPATQFDKEIRWMMAMTPTIAAMGMFASMFDYDDEEDKVVLAEDTEWFFTTGYSPAMARKMGFTESTYEPYTAYKKNENGIFERKFPYRDMPFLWFLAAVGRLQEKLIFDQEESLPTGQTPETKVKDPLTSADAYLAAIRSVLAFSTQGSISSAGGALTAGTELVEGGNPDVFVLKKMAQGSLRQFIPFSALQAEADNYYSLLTQAARRKGVTAVGDVVDKMIMSKPFIENYEFDVLGEDVVQRPSGPPLTSFTTGVVERLGHAMKGDVELKYPNARKVLTRFMDIDKIKKLYFGNIGPESYKATTVWAPEDPQIHHDLSRDAADLKGQAIEEDYENLMSLPKMEFEKKLKKINDDSNESVKIRYAIDKLSYMYDEGMLAEKIKSTKELNEFMVEQSIYIDPEGNIKDFDYLANYEK